MKKMLAIVPVLFALACGGEGPTPPPPIKFDCTNVSAASSFTVNKGTSVTVNYNSNCQSVRASASAPGFPMELPASGSFSFTATQNMTVILTGVAPGKPSVSAAVTVNVIVPPPPTLKFTAPSEVYLNQTISVSVQKTNIKECTPALGWVKSGKEPSNTIIPTWDGASFSPGSTMPVGNRVATLKLVCTGLDNSTVSDSVTIQLLVPKLEIDSISPTVLPAETYMNVSRYSSKRTIVSSNGADFNGTLSAGAPEGAAPPDLSQYPLNPQNFNGPTLYRSGTMLIGQPGARFTSYLYNSERPEQPLTFTITIAK